MIAVVATIVLIVVDRQGLLLEKGGDLARYDGRTFRVVRVVDGDTLLIDAPDGRDPTTRVRLWGIDAPELARPREGIAADPLADEAHAFARRLCEAKTVRILLESHDTRDKYNRVLAYIELPEGAVLNEQLLVAGMARADGRFPHRWSQRYELLEKQARYDRVGLWAGQR